MKYEKEIWRDIKDYGGFYQVSNFGNIFGIKRGKILNAQYDLMGYRQVGLSKNGKAITRKISLLVWDAFGNKPRNGRKLQVDHKNANKADDSITNLQLLSTRQNVAKGYKDNGKLLPTGVTIDHNPNRRKKYLAQINIKGKIKNLGYYITTQQAAQAYQNKLGELL